MKKSTNLFISLFLLVISSCSTTKPISATSNTLGSKVGVASGTCYLGVLCFDVDTSVLTAAKNGNISKVSTVDYKVKNYFGIVQVKECIVTGE